MRRLITVVFVLLASRAAAQDAKPAERQVRVTVGGRVEVPGITLDGPFTRTTRPVRATTPSSVTIQLPDGDLIAVPRPRARVEGALVATDAASIVVRTPSGTRLTIPRRSIQQVEVAAPARGTRAPAARGLLIGAALGVGFVSVAKLGCGADCFGFVPTAAAVAGMVGGAGALIGLVVAPDQIWRRVPVDSLQ